MNPAPLRTMPGRWLGGLIFLASLAAAVAQTDMADLLPGKWRIIDNSPALIHRENSETFTILRVMPGESDWADGSFYLKWPGEPRPERGYYSLKNGRVWVTTYRWVNEKRERVEYRGEIDEKDGIKWEGTGSTSSAPKTSWEFEATKS